MTENTPQHQRCFVIGPMKDMARLRLLANKVIKPILGPLGYKIITPDEGNMGTVMDQVLLNLEQADILVADLTGNNPNVMYELGIYHSFGKPSVVVKEVKADAEPEETPFDIAAYRYIEIDLSNPRAAIKILRPRFADILENMRVIDWFPNPVTQFYNSPVAEIPTAVGLSKNYITNFLKVLLPDLFLRSQTSSEFEMAVFVENDARELVALDKAAREKLRFEILIPRKMQTTSHDHIRSQKDGGRLKYRLARVKRTTREFSMNLRFEDDGTPVLVDIPTVLSTLNESIERRMKLQAGQINNKEWNILEAQELERFTFKCQQFKRHLAITHPIIENKVSIVSNWVGEG